MKKIRIRLSQKSIQNAIRKLNTVNQNLRWSVGDIVETLVEDGAEIAQEAYGTMANAVGYMEDETVGKIASTGEVNMIAEFGAGDDTDPATGFENKPDTPVYAGSYSELEGSGEYARTGQWHFGGRKFYGGDGERVPPRHGLLNAKVYIIESAENIAKEVIKL